MFESHQSKRIEQGVTIRYYHFDYPVLGRVGECLRIRERWVVDGRKFGVIPHLDITNQNHQSIKMVLLIKSAPVIMELSSKDYSLHSLHIGGTCALFAGGKSDLVIR